MGLLTIKEVMFLRLFTIKEVLFLCLFSVKKVLFLGLFSIKEQKFLGLFTIKEVMFLGLFIKEVMFLGLFSGGNAEHSWLHDYRMMANRKLQTSQVKRILSFNIIKCLFYHY